MKLPDFVVENPVSQVVTKQVKKHPYLTSALVSGLILAGTMYDLTTYVDPIAKKARQEGYAICSYPTQDEIEFARNLPSLVNPVNRHRVNQIDARVYGCQSTAAFLENRTLAENGRKFHTVETLIAGLSGAVLGGIGILSLISRRRHIVQSSVES